jgi:methionyl aminopeptidase
MPIVYKTQAEIEKMREANQVVRIVLDEMEGMIRPGISTAELGDRACSLVAEHGVEPAFLGYGHPPFPSVVCISVNDEVVHGIPSPRRRLEAGDIVSLDFGVAKDGYFGDAARTIPVGEVPENAAKLVRVTRESLERAIEKCVPGNRLGDVSRAVQEHVEANGFSVVRAFVGHGIGRRMHEDPPVPNFVAPGKNPRLREGMVLAIEPMVNEGSWDVTVDTEDHWTARTRDGKLSAHFEHSVAITKDGPDVLSGPSRGRTP